MNNYEKIAFNNAEKIYFPSVGAKNAFINTTKNNINIQIYIPSHIIHLVLAGYFYRLVTRRLSYGIFDNQK